MGIPLVLYIFNYYSIDTRHIEANGTFGPNDNLSCAMLAQILYNRAGKPTMTGSSAFTDAARRSKCLTASDFNTIKKGGERECSRFYLLVQILNSIFV